MVNPTRDTAAGPVYKDLLNSARRERRATDEVMSSMFSNDFYRLATSPPGANISCSGADCGTFAILGYPLATVIAEELSTAIEATAAHRQITLRPLSTSITGLPQ